MEVYLVRHGRTPWNARRLIQGRTDISLAPDGIAIAQEYSKKIRDIHFDRIFSSPLKRAYETAEILRGDRDIPIETDDRLKEICFGENEGRDSLAILHNPEDPFHYFYSAPEKYKPAPGGETFEEVIARGASFLHQVVEPLQDKCQRIMIVGHGAFNKGLMCTVAGREVKDYWGPGIQPNCGAIIFTLENGKYTILSEIPRTGNQS